MKTNKDLDPTGFLELLSIIELADAAGLKLDWRRAIELHERAMAVIPEDLSQSKPQLKAEILKAIGHCYQELGQPDEADRYFAESIKCIESTAQFQADKKILEGHLRRPLRELPFEVDGLQFVDEPYDGLVAPDELPMLQHTVHILRPYGINVHAWMYETTIALQEDIEAGPQKFLPEYLSASDIARLSKPRRYHPDEAVMMRGKDGYTYKLEAPGTLTKLPGSKANSHNLSQASGKPLPRKRKLLRAR